MADDKLAEILSAPDAADESNPADSPEVTRCCDAWTRAFEAETASSGDRVSATFAAKTAYRDAMPQLIGYENIRDFIACTAQGMLLGTLQESQCSKLLYAA